jgi:DNA-3-methyladenine glycosylase II
VSRVHVALPQPFDFELSLERFRTFGPDPANLWRDSAFHRVFDGREAQISAADGGVAVEPGDVELVRPVRRFLGACFDLARFEAFAADDPVLARVVSRLRGFRPALIPDAFEMLVTSVTAQQVSLRAALAIRVRLVERFGRRFRAAWAFPSRDALAAAAPEELRRLGLSRRKAEYVRSLASSEIDLAAIGELPDSDVRALLIRLPGIGEWTVDWFLARHLGRPDVWPAGDLGLRKAVARFYFDGRELSPGETRAFGARMTPFGNLAAQYLLLALRVSG